MAPPTPRLRRDRFTVTLYGSFIVWGWLLYSFNPSVPLLADDLGISSAQAGLHGTAMAVGGIAAAFVAPWLVRTRGRRSALVSSCLLVAAGIVAILAAPGLAWSLTAMLFLSLGGNVAIASAQPGLVVHHGPAASAAVTEANGVGASVGLVGPLAVGATVALGWGWRPAVAVTAVLAVASALLYSRLPVGGAMTPPRDRRRASEEAVVVDLPAATPPDGVSLDAQVVDDAAERSRRLARIPAWCFLASLVAGVSLEFATTYWSTDLVREQTGAGAGIAAATTAGLVLGMAAIRFVVGPVSLRVSPALLLAGSFLVSIVGWAVLWTATSPGVAIAGLVVAGLGYGAQYPLSISLLLATASGSGDRAQGRATFAGSVAVGVAPFALGALADAVGAHQAFVVVPVVALLGAAAASVGGRAQRRLLAAGAAETTPVPDAVR
ncbi:MFS transporter [Cellulomonas sp.]|uniref:MFS transporter n=1 Tax=Cellulomonas sp. TaxID=40001 RepID=UPI001B1BA1DA|nr:MFS transporter [Cellulomonas sp.]MBO9556109.1 MFS transporter [Cellulomonas sp.]